MTNYQNQKNDIKSPDFTPRPGWGGKLKKWLNKNHELNILKLVATITLVLGIYLLLNK